MAEREAMEFDVVVVGAGPAGLAAAIRLKQLAPEATVCVVEKGSEVGAHILSGAVIEPRALDELLPDWRTQDAPLATEAKEDRFLYLTATRAIRLPTPPQMHNHGNRIGSLGDLCRWLAVQAEALGVEIYPGFAAAELLEQDGRIVGVATGEMGVEKSGERGPNYQPGMELRAAYTLFAEGCRGSLSQAADGPLRPASAASIRRPTRSASRSYGRSRPSGTGRGWSSTRSAGRWTAAPMAARSSITGARPTCRTGSWSGWITATRGSRRSRRCSGSRRIRRCGRISRAGGGWPMARGR